MDLTAYREAVVCAEAMDAMDLTRWIEFLEFEIGGAAHSETRVKMLGKLKQIYADKYGTSVVKK